MDTTHTFVGNLTADSELRFVPSGAAVANFTVAVTPRMFDKNANEWKDLETTFWRCNVWREAAEKVAASLHKGDKVIVVGKIRSRSYETEEGEKRTVQEIEVDEVGPSLRNATAQVTRASRGGQSAPAGNGWGAPQAAPAAAPSQTGGSPFDTPPF